VHRIIGTWESGGARVPGTYRVILPVRITDTTGNLVHHKGIYASGNLTVSGSTSLDINVPATNDVDLSPQGWQIIVQAFFTAGGSETYVIPAPDAGTTDLSDVVLPETLGEPEPVLIRGVAGGIAELDADGDVIDADGAKVTGGGSALTNYSQVSALTGYPATFPPTIGATGVTAVAGNDARLTDTRTPTNSSVTNAKVAVGAAVDLDKTADSATRLAMTAAQVTKLAGVATGATANSADATLLARANHTGTQSADSLTDGTTNKAFLATERTKLSGIATSATANDTDANLKARANHTGTQTAATVSDFSAAADARIAAAAGVSVQPLDSDLTTLAGLAATTDNFIQAKSSAWASRTPAQVKTDLALTKTDVGLANVDNTSDANKPLSTADLAALSNRAAFAVPQVNDYINQAASAGGNNAYANGDMALGPMSLPPGTYDRACFNVTTLGSAGSVAKIVAYSDTNGRPGTLILDSSTVDCTTTGIKEITISLVVPAGGLFIWIGSVTQGATAGTPQFARCQIVPINVVRTVASLGAVDSMAWYNTGVNGAAPSPWVYSAMTSTHTRIAFRRSA
jgi:hypothetical protein